MVPSWEYCWDVYFEDFTHKTPFMIPAMHDLHLIEGFAEVQVNFFIQLPLTWSDPLRIWRFLSFLTRKFAPSNLRYKYKWVRFSKEIMILCTAGK